METKKWTEIMTDENTGARVLVLHTILNGIVVNEAYLGDDDAMREMNDY